MGTADPLSDNELSDLEIAARNYLMDAFVYGEGLDPGDPAIRDWLLEQTVELGFQLSQALQAYVGFGLELPPGSCS